MKDYKKELIKNAEEILESACGKRGKLTQQCLDWIYGAISFAYGAGLIDIETKVELCERYNLYG